MSARFTTVKQLRAMLAEYPDDMLVVSVHPNQQDWSVEGTVDGVRVHEIIGHEVRTGWHVIHPSESDLDHDWPACRRLLLVHDFTGENLLEWQDEALDGPSPFAPGFREE